MSSRRTANSHSGSSSGHRSLSVTEALQNIRTTETASSPRPRSSNPYTSIPTTSTLDPSVLESRGHSHYPQPPSYVSPSVSSGSNYPTGTMSGYPPYSQPISNPYRSPPSRLPPHYGPPGSAYGGGTSPYVGPSHTGSYAGGNGGSISRSPYDPAYTTTYPGTSSHYGGPGGHSPGGTGYDPYKKDPVVIETPSKPQCWEHGCNGRQFSTFSNLLRHQREKSGSSTKSTCHRCGAEFTRKTARDGHLAHDKCKQKSPDRR